jgi:hypothetical protein
MPTPTMTIVVASEEGAPSILSISVFAAADQE